MSLIDATYFKGEISIAQRSQLEVQENLQVFIDKYEPKILNLLLGSEFNTLFTVGLAVLPVENIEARWTALKANETLKQIIANYVYYWYMRNQATQTVGIGEVIPTAENATVISPSGKMVRAWNEMVDLCRVFTLDSVIYPEWVTTFIPVWDRYRSGYVYPDIFTKINSLNI